MKALADLRADGLRLRALTLTARDKICLRQGQPCDPRNCPLALGYYDRLIPAMRQALLAEDLSREALEAVSREHQLCPYALSLDVSVWVDAVVCDYNYVFDPRVRLRRHFDDHPGDYAFLVDEAHNLVDRAREMFSASLDFREIQAVRRAIQAVAPRCAKAFGRLGAAGRKLCGPASPAAAADELAAFSPELDSVPCPGGARRAARAGFDDQPGPASLNGPRVSRPNRSGRCPREPRVSRGPGALARGRAHGSRSLAGPQ